MASPNEYFTRTALQYDAAMDIPSSLAALHQAFIVLGADRAKFLRACYWFHHAREVFSHSQSASYVALVHAIETLLPNTGQTVGRRFDEFLHTYIPSDGQPDLGRDRLYRVRSQISHGAILFEADIAPGHLWGGLNPRRRDELLMAHRARELTRIGVVNWLSHHSADQDACLVTAPLPPFPTILQSISARS
jgi:hypothetical protein